MSDFIEATLMIGGFLTIMYIGLIMCANYIGHDDRTPKPGRR